MAARKSPKPTLNRARSRPSLNGHGAHAGFVDNTPTLNKLVGLLTNATSVGREGLLTSMGDPRRSVEDECGYPPIGEPVSVELFRRLYDRSDVGNRVVQLMPKECWKAPPNVFETEDPDDATPFELDWDALNAGLNIGQSWHSNDEQAGGMVWETLSNVDTLSRIGSFGLVLIGLDDGKNLQEPVDGLVTTTWQETPVKRPTTDPRTGQVKQKVVGIKRSNPKEEPVAPDDAFAKGDLQRAMQPKKVWTGFDKKTKQHQYEVQKPPPLTDGEKVTVNRWEAERATGEQVKKLLRLGRTGDAVGLVDNAAYPAPLRQEPGERIGWAKLGLTANERTRLAEVKHQLVLNLHRKWLIANGFDPDQPRDEHGEWSSSGGGGESQKVMPPKAPRDMRIAATVASFKTTKSETGVKGTVRAETKHTVLSRSGKEVGTITESREAQHVNSDDPSAGNYVKRVTVSDRKGVIGSVSSVAEGKRLLASRMVDRSIAKELSTTTNAAADLPGPPLKKPKPLQPNNTFGPEPQPPPPQPDPNLVDDPADAAGDSSILPDDAGDVMDPQLERPDGQPQGDAEAEGGDATGDEGDQADQEEADKHVPSKVVGTDRQYGTSDGAMSSGFGMTPANYGTGPNSQGYTGAVPDRGQDQQGGSYATGGQGGGTFAGSMGTDQQYYGVQMGGTEYMAATPVKQQQKRRVVFLNAYDESLVQVVRYEWNVNNPRFGHPVMYRVTLNDPREVHSGVGLPLATVFVHWSRVIHVNDRHGNSGASKIFSAPSMRPVVNRVLDLYKVPAAASEGYWQSGTPTKVFESHPQMGGDVLMNVDSIRDEVEQAVNSLVKVLTGRGGSWKLLAPAMVDPTPFIQTLIELICIQLGCPVRIFKGAERGELASSQDDGNWNDRVRGRQNGYLTPRVICPLIDRLIMLGVLTQPASYGVEWPDLESLSEKDKATIALTKTQAAAAYVSGNVEALIPPREWFADFLGLSDEQAEAYVEAAAGHQEEMQSATQDQLDAQAQQVGAQSELADAYGFKLAAPDGMVDPDQQKMDHDVNLAKAKNPGFGPGGGGGPPGFGQPGAKGQPGMGAGAGPPGAKPSPFGGPSKSLAGGASVQTPTQPLNPATKGQLAAKKQTPTVPGVG